MTTASSLDRKSTRFKVGWDMLIFLAAGIVLGQLGLLFFNPGGDTVFLGFAAYNLLAAIILANPYRRGEKWAWYAIWAMILPYALVIIYNTDVGFIYLGEAVVMALCQFLTYSSFSNSKSIQ
jgi:hypothetical protein